MQCHGHPNGHDGNKTQLWGRRAREGSWDVSHLLECDDVVGQWAGQHAGWRATRRACCADRGSPKRPTVSGMSSGVRGASKPHMVLAPDVCCASRRAPSQTASPRGNLWSRTRGRLAHLGLYREGLTSQPVWVAQGPGPGQGHGGEWRALPLR